MTDIAGYAYGLTVFAGGLVGYIKGKSWAVALGENGASNVDPMPAAQSTMSLLAGSLFGALACLGAFQASNDPKNVTLALIVSLLLLYVMGGRFYRGRKFMPAGLVTLLRYIASSSLSMTKHTLTPSIIVSSWSSDMPCVCSKRDCCSMENKLVLLKSFKCHYSLGCIDDNLASIRWCNVDGIQCVFRR